MEQKDKELLLQDLCARLPYGVKIQYDIYGIQDLSIHELNAYIKGIKNIKPYLRPMSSMPEEESEFLNKMALENSLKCIEEEDPQKVFSLRIKHDVEELAYLYKHHYDVFGLIPKDLALSTETYNPYKD